MNIYKGIMDINLLTRQNRSTRPQIVLFQKQNLDIRLDLGRVHECAGRARRSFALMLAAQLSGPILWITPQYETQRPNPDGIRPFLDPARLLFATPQRPVDSLWSMEETLRSGVVPLVVADLNDYPALTPVRRLHLAAETGAKYSAKAPPLGVLLTPDKGGAAGVETRWLLQPDSTEEQPGWQLKRLRARRAPPRAWHIAQTPDYCFTAMI